MNAKRNQEGAVARRQLGTVATQLAAIERMTVAELRVEYERLFGRTTTTRNRDHLRKKLAWRIQELAEGGLSEVARRQIDILGQRALQMVGLPRKTVRPVAVAAQPIPAHPEPRRDSRLPPTGSVLQRRYQDVNYEVRVLDEGFEYGGKSYRSLSLIAREITGTSWNGYAFFGLLARGGGQS